MLAIALNMHYYQDRIALCNKKGDTPVKFAYSTLACPHWTVEEAVDAAVRYGYDAVEWRLADGEIIAPDTPEMVLRRIRDGCAGNGIAVACLDSSCRVVQETPQERANTIEAAQRMTDIATAIGAPFLRVFGGHVPQGMTRKAMIEPTAQVLNAIGTFATERGITIVLETHDDWSQSMDALELVQTANSNISILWDIHHTYRSGESPDQSVAELGKSIAYVHVKDGCPQGSQAGTQEEWELCLISEGVVPLREAFAALKREGYDGYLSLEWEKKWHPNIAEPEVALPQALPWLQRFWQEA
jgi:sugar phosphate isomerase/epimerase